MGKIRLVVIAGVFIQSEDSRADLLLVVDDLQRTKLDQAVHSMEAEIGRELSYGIFDSKDFNYRLSVYDKFVRDVLDYPHEKILDKIGL